MGLSFPALRVEQARFSLLTTCLTTWGEMIDILFQICYNIFAKFKGAKCVWRVEEVMFMKAVFKAVMILSSENVKNE